jgi:hypothetical protein
MASLSASLASAEIGPLLDAAMVSRLEDLGRRKEARVWAICAQRLCGQTAEAVGRVRKKST